MRKQRRGSTDLDWINKYQHSDHHVDRQTRKKFENKSGEFPVGLPPTPNHHFTSSIATRKNKYDDSNLDFSTLNPQRFGFSSRYSPKLSNDFTSHDNYVYKQRSNSLSHSLQPFRQEQFVDRSCSPFVGRRNSFVNQAPIISTSRRGSVVDNVTPYMSSTRSWRATSLPQYEVNGRRTSYVSPGSITSYASPGSRTSYVLPGSRMSYASPGSRMSYASPGSRMSYASPIIYSNPSFNRRSSLSINGGLQDYDNNKRTSTYNNDKRNSFYYIDDNKRVSIFDNNNNNNRYYRPPSTGSYVSSYFMRPTTFVKY